MASNHQADYPLPAGQAAPNIFVRLLHENPLTLGLIAVAIGALIGLLIPETGKENALMGRKRDELKQQAQDKVEALAQSTESAAHDALNKAEDAARHILTDAVDTVKEEARSQGLPVGV